MGTSKIGAHFEILLRQYIWSLHDYYRYSIHLKYKLIFQSIGKK